MTLLWIVASVIFGVTFWLIAIITESTRLRSKSYGTLILIRSVAMLVAVIVYFGFRGAAEFATSDSGGVKLWSSVLATTFSPFTGVVLLYAGVTTVVFNFIRQMCAMVGSRVLVNLLLGKYHHPRVEDRIFMFLDLEGSTTIAEKIGHQDFCRLIQESFRDLAEVSVRREVEIYQYVGDEAILTWNPAQGLQDCNCLHVFFDFERQLLRRREFYRERFGLVPRFKAGANIGSVTVAEVGVLKRDIAYLSDVLNTAARLESLCRQQGTGLLIADALKQAIVEDSSLDFEPAGRLELRGKLELVDVYRVDLKLEASLSQAVNRGPRQAYGLLHSGTRKTSTRPSRGAHLTGPDE